MVTLRPLGLWNDTLRVYALAVLLVYFVVSVISSGIFLWPLLADSTLAVTAIVSAIGAAFALFAALCSGLAYRMIDADLHPLLRLLGLSMANALIPAVLFLFLLGGSILELLPIFVPLVAFHAVWSGLFLIGRRPRPPRRPLPPIAQSSPRGWDSQH